MRLDLWIPIAIYYLLGGNMVLIALLGLRELKSAFEKYGKNRLGRLLIIIFFTIFWLPSVIIYIVIKGLQFLFQTNYKLINNATQPKT